MMRPYRDLNRGLSDAVNIQRQTYSWRHSGACSSNSCPALACLSEHPACEPISGDALSFRRKPRPQFRAAEAVIIGENSLPKPSLSQRAASTIAEAEDPHMRPRDLADRMSRATASTTFTLPIAEARTKAREIIGSVSRDGNILVIENWHLVSGDRIEFTVRNLSLRRSD
jgi:hypothetical protein